MSAWVLVCVGGVLWATGCVVRGCVGAWVRGGRVVGSWDEILLGRVVLLPLDVVHWVAWHVRWLLLYTVLRRGAAGCGWAAGVEGRTCCCRWAAMLCN